MTSPNPLPESVVAFLDAEIFSIPQLEILLLVQAADGAAMSVDRLAQDFYLPASAFEPWLHALAGRGLLRHDADGYRALPPTDPRAQAVADVADCYARRRISVTRQVYAAKDDPARRFADAFRLRKDRKP